MLNFKLIVVVAVFFLNGCVTSATSKEEVTDVVENSTANIETEIKVEKETAIDSDVLYLLLVAEIAGQRGAYDVALEGYLRAAEKVDEPKVAERAAKIAAYLKNDAKTEQAVSQWLKNDTESLPARKMAALSALRANDKVTALKHLNFLLEKDPAGFEVSLLDLVKISIGEGQGEFFYEVLESLSVQHPDKATVYFVQAILATQLKKDDLALLKVEKALELQPNWNKALALHAQLALQTGNVSLAKAILEEAIVKDPENIIFKGMLAQVFLKTENYQQAVVLYEEMIKLEPSNEETRYRLALVYLQLKQEEKAKDLLLNLSDSRRWQSQANIYLGKIAANQNNVADALVWFDKVTVEPLAFEASVSAVALLIEKQRYVEAKQRLNALKTVEPEQKLRLVLVEAELLTKQKKYQQAFDVLTRRLKESPKQPELLYSRALVAENLDKLDILETDLLAVLEKYPNDINALNALGYTLANRTQRYEDANKYLSKALALKPNEPVIIDSYGWLQFRLGNLGQAKLYLERAYSKLKEAEIAAHLVEVLWVMEEKQQAKVLFSKAWKMEPNNEYLLELKQRITELD